MVIVEYGPVFEKRMKKMKHASLAHRMKVQIRKIVDQPEIGKPMRHDRRGTRGVCVKPFRLSYAYLNGEDKIIFLDFYHKDEQ